MRQRYLVAYDISEPRRLREVHATMLRFGEPMQYSVFLCDLTAMQHVQLRIALTDAMHRDEDRILIIDLGPADGRGDRCIEQLGRQHGPPDDHDAVVV